MPKRDWLRNIALTLAAVASLAVFAAAGLFTWSQYQSGSRAYQEYQQRAYNDQRQSADKIANDCAVRDAPVGVVANCLADGIEARQKRSDTNQDLKAQQDMAFWALGVFVVSAISLPVSIAGLTAIFISLRHTRESIVNDRAIGEAQVRAYLQILAAHIQIDETEQYIRLRLDMGNSGQSPARNVEAVVRFSFFPNVQKMPFPPPIFPDVWATFHYHDLAAGEKRETDLRGHTAVEVPKAVWGENYERLMGVHVQVVLFADDVFDQEITAIGHFAPGGKLDEPLTESRQMTDMGGWDSQHFRTLLIAQHRPHRQKNRHREE